MKKLQVACVIVLAIAAACSGGATNGSGGGSVLPQAESSALQGQGGFEPRRRFTIGSIQIQLPATILALGQTMTFSLVAKKSNGTVITGGYAHPIVLTAKHLTFSRMRIVNSKQAKTITATWKTGFGGRSSDTIVASAHSVTAKAHVKPGTGFAYYIVGNNPNTDVSGFQMALGPDGKIYYGTSGANSTDGAVGQLDPSTGAAQEIELHSVPFGLLFSNDGALWIAGGNSHNLFRLPSGQFSASALQTIAVPSPSSHVIYTPRELTEDGNGNVWFGDLAGNRLLKIPQAGPYITSSIAAYVMPNGPVGTPQSAPSMNGLSYGVDGAIYALDQDNGTVDRVNPASGSTLGQSVMPQQAALGSTDSAFPRFLTHDGSGKMFFSYIGTFGSNSSPPPPGIDSFNVGIAPAIKSVSLFSAPSGSQPDSIAAHASLVYYADLFGAIGLIDESTSTTRLAPTQSFADGYAALRAGSNGYHSPNGVVVLPDGTAWFTCYDHTTPLLPLCVGHTVYLSGWSLFPGPAFTLYMGASNSQAIGVMESPTHNSGPFKVVSNAKSICGVSKLKDHNFVVTGKTVGTCNVTVTDASKNSTSVTITVQPLPPGGFSRTRASRRF